MLEGGTINQLFCWITFNGAYFSRISFLISKWSETLKKVKCL